MASNNSSIHHPSPPWCSWPRAHRSAPSRCCANRGSGFLHWDVPLTTRIVYSWSWIGLGFCKKAADHCTSALRGWSKKSVRASKVWKSFRRRVHCSWYQMFTHGKLDRGRTEGQFAMGQNDNPQNNGWFDRKNDHETYSGTWKSMHVWNQGENCMGRRAFGKSNKSMQPGLKHHGTQYVKLLFSDPWQCICLFQNNSKSASGRVCTVVPKSLKLYIRGCYNTMRTLIHTSLPNLSE